jgi:hypothetical protein
MPLTFTRYRLDLRVGNGAVGGEDGKRVVSHVGMQP